MTHEQGFESSPGRTYQCCSDFDRTGQLSGRDCTAAGRSIWDFQASSVSLRSTSTNERTGSVDSTAQKGFYRQAFRHANSPATRVCQIEWEKSERDRHASSGSISLQEVSRGAQQKRIERDSTGLHFRSTLGPEADRSLSTFGPGQELGSGKIRPRQKTRKPGNLR